MGLKSAYCRLLCLIYFLKKIIVHLELLLLFFLLLLQALLYFYCYYYFYISGKQPFFGNNTGCFGVKHQIRRTNMTYVICIEFEPRR